MSDDLARYRRNLAAEIDGAYLYRRLAELETDARLAEVYRRLGDTEARHAEFWADKITSAGGEPPDDTPSTRARLLAWLGARLGPGVLVSVLAAEEQQGQTMYDAQPEAEGTTLPADERSHARLLAAVEKAGGIAGSAVARLEGRHRGVGGNALRAAVLGVNDGLVSNLSLVMGVAGAALARTGVLVAGLAGLLAGSLSMALGEWLSVQSSRELYSSELATEADEIAAFPEEETEELSLIYQAKGVPTELADRLAGELMSGPDRALDAMAREELGIDPDTLGGSAWEAAGASFLFFTLGAAVPVIPFVITGGGVAVLSSLALSAVALFGVGAAITLLTGRAVWRSGLRQVAVGLAAAAITYGVGRVLGVTLAG